jgi:hypothetical protein
MRAAVPAIAVLAMVTAGHAASFNRIGGDRFDSGAFVRAFPAGGASPSRASNFDDPSTHRPIALSDHETFAGHPRADLPLLGPAPTPPPSGNGFSIGPIHADMMTRTSRSGRVSYKPHYRLDGVTFLGGAIGGSIDGRGGMVTLQWRTTP